MTELQKVLRIGDKDVIVTYRNLVGREPLDIQERATRMNLRAKEVAVDTAVLIWERLRSRVLKIDGQDPDWDHMEEPMLWALAKEFGTPPESLPN